jgi:hypothetical protein
MTNRKIIFKPVSSQIEALVQEKGSDPHAVLEILVELQGKHGILTREMLEDRKSVV